MIIKTLIAGAVSGLVLIANGYSIQGETNGDIAGEISFSVERSAANHNHNDMTLDVGHSGGLDRCGGHNCSQSSIEKGLCTGYHYHRARAC